MKEEAKDEAEGEEEGGKGGGGKFETLKKFDFRWVL